MTPPTGTTIVPLMVRWDFCCDTKLKKLGQQRERETVMRAERGGEEVDERWALHASDRTLLGNKTGVTRLGFAVLLKMFQVNGRFPHRLQEVPVAAVEAIASQIEVPAEA
jgi:Domain of unknown function (DUF4158)